MQDAIELLKSRELRFLALPAAFLQGMTSPPRAGTQQTLITGSPFSQISKETLETGPLIFVQCCFLCLQ